jgi:dihydroorotate dehydrogenase electron transfer subunit
MKDTRAAVESIESLKNSYFRMRLVTGWDEGFVPGQFVMIRVPGSEVFLRRPFGILGIEKGVLEICFKTVGRGTEVLSKTKAGEEIYVLGPLGNGFAFKEEFKIGILVAGGYGIVPLIPLAGTLTNMGRKAVLYYGGRTSADILCESEIKSAGAELKITTEDGSRGTKGMVTDLLLKEIPDFKGAALFSAGPKGLLMEVSKIAASFKIPAQLSMDEYMACGIGVCLGCVVKSKNGAYVRVCREGPVFDAKDIIWD